MNTKNILTAKNLEHFSKESIEYVRRRILRLAIGKVPNEIEWIISKLKTQGICILQYYWDLGNCTQAVNRIESAIAHDKDCHHWVDPEGADYRIWEAEKLGGQFLSFLTDPFIEQVRKYYTGIANAEKLLLASRLSYKLGNKGSGGGWHRDSPHSSQFKAILYVSNVTDQNGPFQYIKETHKESSSIQLWWNHLCNPNQYRFTSDEIDNMITSTVQIPKYESFIAPAGTLILVDTKGIHRGQPIQFGARYALTQYCFNGQERENFFKKMP
jgi:hypothetical protein